MPEVTPETIEYAPAEDAESASYRRLNRIAAKVAIIFFVTSFTLFGFAYLTDKVITAKYHGIFRGMTPAQIDQHMWCFSRHPFAATSGKWPHSAGVSYEFLGLGELTNLTVYFKRNGTVEDVIPPE